MDAQLRIECRSLLQQLHSSQRLLKEDILSHGKTDKNVREADNFNTSEKYDTYSKPNYARDKLHSISTIRTETDNGIRYLSKHSESQKARNHILTQQGTNGRSSESLKLGESHCFDQTSHQTETKERFDSLDDNDTISTMSWQLATPNTQMKRKLIDRHTSVPTNLSARDLRDLNNVRRLNYSYTEDDLYKATNCEDKENVKGSTRKSTGILKTEADLSNTGKKSQEFKKQLEDDGNNRKMLNFVKDTTIKPKSLLNSTAYYSSFNTSRKNDSKVRFDSSANEVAYGGDQRLLGYDWIAALLDNDSSLMNQSESFFNELRDFRKSHKDECSNQFYMAGPHTLVDFEPEPVVEALREPKVQPYIVNERLFTEPFRPGLIDNEDEGVKSGQKQKEPNAENPRFVRVSIPRSTLQTPYRVKPHRRRSFDASDSCSLMDHCLLGWETTWPSVIPTAKSVDLNTEAGTTVKGQTTTLAEAERIAAAHNRTEWPLSKPSPALRTLPVWKKHYMDTTLNLTLPSMQNASNTTTGASMTGSESIKRATDKLLNSTYATMYEMERLREERKLEHEVNAENA